ncbi:hypothetical protein [Halocatena marina]|uniref:Uncharacterized protein n=1 Tax=Halocatena marina TaxID=2934937 RepID=A0ABD5YXD9_9EURY|nr:hypothetical protein [Halocatena marina]
MAQAAIDRNWIGRSRASSRENATSSLSTWTRRIVAAEASLTDVPARNRARIAREVKLYTDYFQNIGDSPTVNRLRDELDQAEVSQ